MADKRPVDRNRDGQFSKAMDAVERFVPVQVDDSGRQGGRTISEISAADLDND